MFTRSECWYLPSVPHSLFLHGVQTKGDASCASGSLDISVLAAQLFPPTGVAGHRRHQGGESRWVLRSRPQAPLTHEKEF